MINSALSSVLTLVCANSELYQKYSSIIENILFSNDIKLFKKQKLASYAIDYLFKINNNSFIKLEKLLKSKKFKEVDICFQKKIHRKKKIIACDMDMTAINVETINLIGEQILKNKDIQNLTKKAMQGDVGFKESILLRTQMLAGIDVNDIVSLLPDIQITPGIVNVIKTMNNNGSHSMLISGGYDIFANKIAKIIGFKEIVCNKLKIKNNLLTGEIAGRIIDRNAKLNYFKNRIKLNNINLNETMAVGDGDNDIDMIKYASLGVAWKAYPAVSRAADVSVYNDMNSLLYFQGFKHSEIIY